MEVDKNGYAVTSKYDRTRQVGLESRFKSNISASGLRLGAQAVAYEEQGISSEHGPQDPTCMAYEAVSEAMYLAPK